MSNLGNINTGNAIPVVRQFAGKRGRLFAAFGTLFALVFVLFVAIPAHGQFWDKLTNPQITVNLTHPPRLGLNLKKVAFGPASGPCSSEILDRLAASLLSNGIEVVDRYTFSSLLAQQHMNMGGSLDSQSAARMGQFFGPGALVFLNVSRCEVERHREVSGERCLAGWRRGGASQERDLRRSGGMQAKRHRRNPT